MLPTAAPPRYDLVVFDLDGTLIDSVGDIADALNAALRDRVLPTHQDDAVRRMIGEGVRQLVTYAVGPARAAASPDEVDAIAVSYRRHYHARPLGRTALYPGVRETLDALAGLAPPVALAVATNKPGSLSRAILDGLGLAERFFAILGEDDVGARKPDPRIVEVLRSRAAVAADRVLFVGDSPTDAATARAAGVDFCLLTYGYATDAERAAIDPPPRYRAGNFRELVPLLSPGRSRPPGADGGGGSKLQ